MDFCWTRNGREVLLLVCFSWASIRQVCMGSGNLGQLLEFKYVCSSCEFCLIDRVRALLTGGA